MFIKIIPKIISIIFDVTILPNFGVVGNSSDVLKHHLSEVILSSKCTNVVE